MIKECNTLREEKKNLKENLSALEKALEIITKELARLAYESESLLDMEKQQSQQDLKQISYDVSDLQNNSSQNKLSNMAKPRQPYVSPFTRYKTEKPRMYQSMNLPKQTIETAADTSNKKKNAKEQQLLNSLMKEIDIYSKDKNNQTEIYDRLREKVQSYLLSEDSSITLPQISRVDKTILGS